MRNLVSMIGGALASTLLATSAGASMAPLHKSRTATHGSAMVESYAGASKSIAGPALGPVAYAIYDTATGGPSGGLPDRN